MRVYARRAGEGEREINKLFLMNVRYERKPFDYWQKGSGRIQCSNGRISSNDDFFSGHTANRLVGHVRMSIVIQAAPRLRSKHTFESSQMAKL